MRAPLSRPWRIVRSIVVPILIAWSVVAAVALFPGPLVSAVAGIIAGDDPPQTGRPSQETCEDSAPDGRVPVTGHSDPDGTLRVFAIQYRIDIEHMSSYETYRTAMRCLMETLVEPYRQPDQPTLVVFPEGIGLPTLAISQRGATVRAQAATPLRAPLGGGEVALTGAMLQLNTAYAQQIAAYQAKFGLIDPRKQVLVAATDTLVRAFSTTFSDIARDYGVYVVAANTMAEYRESSNPLEIALFADPSLLPASTAYVAASDRVTNSTFLWGPDVVDPDAPDGATNLLFKNEKVPLTAFEKDFWALDEGLATGLAAPANIGPVDVAGFSLSFATGLPAFQYGYELGESPGGGIDPCADVRTSYVPCLDELGVDVMIQSHASPERWASADQSGGWLPMEAMSSTWRAVADPTLDIRYNVTAMMTGNLLDLAFDGQSAITARDEEGLPMHYAGNDEFVRGDFTEYRPYAGQKTEFLALAPWVLDGDRDELEATAEALAPGSGDDLEGQYVETAIFADLVPSN
jgi:hypothetical protein